MPIFDPTNQDSINSYVLNRLIPVLLENESATTRDFSDTIAISKNSRTFVYDASDTTSINDDMAVLVDQNGRRYINEDIPMPVSVLGLRSTSVGLTPSIGDSWIVIASQGTMGNFAGQVGKIVTYTGKGWLPIPNSNSLGQIVWDTSISGYRHYAGPNQTGIWTQGLGNLSLSAGTVTPSANVFPGGLIVESVVSTPFNTNSSHVGRAYLIGSNASGIWVSQRNNIAYVLRAGSSSTSFEYITRKNGMRIWRNDVNALFVWQGFWDEYEKDGEYLNDLRSWTPADFTIVTQGQGASSRRAYRLGGALPRIRLGSDKFEWQVTNRHGVTCTWQKTVTAAANQSFSFNLEVYDSANSNMRRFWLTRSNTTYTQASSQVTLKTEGSRRFYEFVGRIDFTPDDLNVPRKGYWGPAAGQSPIIVMTCTDEDFFPVGIPTGVALQIDLQTSAFRRG